MEHNLKITISEMSYQKIMHWVHKTNFEISGFGSVSIDDNVMHVEDVMLLKQENSMVETDIDANAINEMMFKLGDSPKFWWHSHVNMAVFWSGTDMKTIEELGKQDWFLATVFNKKEEMRTAYIQSNPIPLFVDDIDLQVVAEIPPELITQWDKDYKANVTEKQISTKIYGPGTYKDPCMPYMGHKPVSDFDEYLLGHQISNKRSSSLYEYEGLFEGFEFEDDPEVIVEKPAATKKKSTKKKK